MSETDYLSEDCGDCGTCSDCVERSRAFAEEMHSEDQIRTLCRRILVGEANPEDDPCRWSIEELDDGVVEVLVWSNVMCCQSGEQWAGDHLVTCGECHGYTNPFLCGARFKVECLDTCTVLPKEKW